MASHKRVGSLSGFWDLFTKLHKSRMDERRLTISSKAFSKMWLASQAGPGPKNPIPKVNLLCGKFSRAACTLKLPVSGLSQGIVDR